ncbi:hypothetical protein DSO57_1031089 [Entomophthora muscae]|uniref:Uncharacterized protein n=1 Tax=Entomophthora muscae TaxID=34485 RepID=A0ACC2UKK5_9FUNG|nr:hypothetical protein DSO57_1031089 [Entomophthora muscae]
MDIASKAQALNIFVYSKIWYIAHILPFSQTLEKKIATITRTYLGVNRTRPQSRWKLLQDTKEGGIGLLPFAENARKLWAKSFLRCMEETLRSPALGRAINWTTAVIKSPQNQANMLRDYLYKHPLNYGPRGIPKYWKACMRALRVVQWTVGEPETDDPLLSSEL